MSAREVAAIRAERAAVRGMGHALPDDVVRLCESHEFLRARVTVLEAWAVAARAELVQTIREKADVEDLSPSGEAKIAAAFRQLADEIEADFCGLPWVPTG